MSALTISLASLCEKADGSQARENLWICPDLVRPGTAAANDDTLYSLSSYGALMVVASPITPGPSGLKAADVVTNAIYRHFRFIPSRATRNDNGIRGFLGDSISAAADALNDFAEQNPEYEGTCIDVIVGWLINGRFHLAWTGDTYAYVFNPANGLSRLTHDYSDTPGSPEINIHTYPVHRNDVFMACSNDVAQALSPHALESILIKSPYLVPTLDEMWDTLQAQGGVDDATIALLRIDSASTPAPPVPQGWQALYAPEPEPVIPADDDEDADVASDPHEGALDNGSSLTPVTEILIDGDNNNDDNDDDDTSSASGLRAILWGVLGGLIVIVAFGIFYFNNYYSDYDDEADSLFSIDSISWLVIEEEIDTTTPAPVDTVTPEPTDTLKEEKTDKKKSSYDPYSAPSILDYSDDFTSPSSTPDRIEETPMPQKQTELKPHHNFDPEQGVPL